MEQDKVRAVFQTSTVTSASLGTDSSNSFDELGGRKTRLCVCKIGKFSQREYIHLQPGSIFRTTREIKLSSVKNHQYSSTIITLNSKYWRTPHLLLKCKHVLPFIPARSLVEVGLVARRAANPSSSSASCQNVRHDHQEKIGDISHAFNYFKSLML
jgi:hypothetical protein